MAPSWTRFQSFLDWTHLFKANPWLNLALAAGNLSAVWYGYTDYYKHQLAATHPGLRPFVADSPNAVLAFAITLLLFLLKLRHPLLDLLAWVVNIKVGLWTTFVLLYYFQEFFDHDAALRWLLFWLHIGMIGQVFVHHRDLRTRPLPTWVFAAIALWVVFGDVLDYSIPIHPILPGSDPRVPGEYQTPTVTIVVTFVITLATLAWAWILYRPGAPRPADPTDVGTRP